VLTAALQQALNNAFTGLRNPGRKSCTIIETTEREAPDIAALTPETLTQTRREAAKASTTGTNVYSVVDNKLPKGAKKNRTMTSGGKQISRCEKCPF
jgi:hypothetical protein